MWLEKCIRAVIAQTKIQLIIMCILFCCTDWLEITKDLFNLITLGQITFKSRWMWLLGRKASTHPFILYFIQHLFRILHCFWSLIPIFVLILSNVHFPFNKGVHTMRGIVTLCYGVCTLSCQKVGWLNWD